MRSPRPRRRPQPSVARLVAAGLVVALAAGCGDSPTSGEAFPPERVPADPRLADIYRQSCRSCHTDPGTGAPLAGDREAWSPRLEQGMATLVRHTVEGYKGMPPLGGCFDCSRDDFRGLIRFMASRDRQEADS